MSFNRGAQALILGLSIILLAACSLGAGQTPDNSGAGDDSQARITDLPPLTSTPPFSTATPQPTRTPQPTATTGTINTGGNSGGTNGGTGNGIVVNPGGTPPATVCNVTPFNVQAVNIRQGPGTSYTVIGTLITYAPLMTGRDGWYQILLPTGASGWVSGSVTTLVGACGGNPGPVPVYRIANSGTPPTTMCAVVNSTGADIPVYGLPLQTPTLVPQTPVANLGTWAQALSRHADGSIEIIIRAGVTGWVDGNRVVTTAPCAQVFGGGGGSLPVLNLPGERIPAAMCAAVHPGGTLVIYVYSQPNGAAVAIMGNAGRVLGLQNGWLHITDDNGHSGWVSANQPGIIGPCNDMPETPLPMVGELAGPGSPLPSDVCAAMHPDSIFAVFIYAQANTNTTPVAVLHMSGWVPAIGRNGDFTQVQWSISGVGYTGWVQSPQINLFNCDTGQIDYTTLPGHNDDRDVPEGVCVAMHPASGTQFVLIYRIPNSMSIPFMRLDTWAEVVYRSNDGWLQVRLNERETGWVRQDTIALNGPC